MSRAGAVPDSSVATHGNQQCEAEVGRLNPPPKSSGMSVAGKQEQERLPHPQNQQDPDHRAGAGQQQGLDQKLRREAGAPGPQRQPHPELPLAGYRAGQQQVGDVGADDQQQEQRERHQNPQRLEQHALGAEMPLPERRHGEVDAPVGGAGTWPPAVCPARRLPRAPARW